MNGFIQNLASLKDLILITLLLCSWALTFGYRKVLCWQIDHWNMYKITSDINLKGLVPFRLMCISLYDETLCDPYCMKTQWYDHRFLIKIFLNAIIWQSPFVCTLVVRPILHYNILQLLPSLLIMLFKTMLQCNLIKLQ